MKFYCIADEDTVRGFRLAGVPGAVAASGPEAAAAIATAAASPDCGIVVLTQALADSIRPLVEQMRFERDRPLIVEIPGPQGVSPGRKSLRQLVQEAVGLRLDSEKGN
jgi:V/A-type H+-transporting ATPase subunit F